MRRFQLQRDVDASGVSGTGVVAQGVEFSDGSCALRWLTATASTAVYASATDVIAIHGHEGRTRLVWVDSAPFTCGRQSPQVNVEFSPPARTLETVATRRMRVIARLNRAHL